MSFLDSLLGPSNLLGLDIGSSTIKIAQTDLVKKGVYKLKGFNFTLLNQPNQEAAAMYAQKNVNFNQMVSNSIFDLLTPMDVKVKKVAVGGFGSSVIVKKITFPKMSKADVIRECQGKVENYIHYALEDVHLNFIFLDNLNKKDPNNIHLLLVTIAKENVFELSEMIFSSGLEFSVMDVEGFALANCFEANYGISDSQVVLINFGSSITNFVILEKGEVIYCQDTAVGGEKYTTEIASYLKVSFEEAESLKISYSKQGEAPEGVQKCVEKVNESVYDEILGNLNFFQKQNDKSHISKIYITGGSSSTVGLKEVLSKIAPCEKLDPFRRIQPASHLTSDYQDQIRDICSISLGLSLRKDNDRD